MAAYSLDTPLPISQKRANKHRQHPLWCERSPLFRQWQFCVLLSGYIPGSWGPFLHYDLRLSLLMSCVTSSPSPGPSPLPPPSRDTGFKCPSFSICAFYTHLGTCWFPTEMVLYWRAGKAPLQVRWAAVSIGNILGALSDAVSASADGILVSSNEKIRLRCMFTSGTVGQRRICNYSLPKSHSKRIIFI